MLLLLGAQCTTFCLARSLSTSAPPTIVKFKIKRAHASATVTLNESAFDFRGPYWVPSAHAAISLKEHIISKNCCDECVGISDESIVIIMSPSLKRHNLSVFARRSPLAALLACRSHLTPGWQLCPQGMTPLRSLQCMCHYQWQSRPSNYRNSWGASLLSDLHSHP